MKTVSTTSKIGRTLLAALLAAFVCVTPATLSAAYADEPGEMIDGIDTTGMSEEQIQELLRKKALEEQAAQNNEAETAAQAETDTEAPADPEATDTSDEASAADQTDGVETADLNVVDMAPTANDAKAAGEAAMLTESKATAAAAATDAPAPAERDGNTFKVGTFMQLHDALQYDINAQSGQDFVISLTDDIILEEPVVKYRDEATHKLVYTLDTHGNHFKKGTDSLRVRNGNTVTILGNGHSFIFTDNTVNNITPGTIDANLILGKADGSDLLTFTFTGSNHELGTLLDITGGSLAIHDGVTLSNNVNATAYPGGGLSASNGAVVTMDGGLIEGDSGSNITWGGGVSIDGATFNMTGGTIRGNSVDAMGDYLGYGGGVALGAHSDASTFNMSGNAVIENNSAPNGGGVYVGPNSTFTMSGNAAVRNNTATTQGGGVYVAQGGTFTMNDNASVTGNNAPHGGGLINYGTAKVSNVYDNDAGTAGADIYNAGSDGATITMEPVHEDWSLSREQATSDPNGANGSGAGAPTDTQPDLKPIHFASFMAMPAAATLSADDAASNADAPAAATTAATNPSNKTIDDWYYDGHRETGETDENGNATVDRSRWNANPDTADTPQYLQHYAATSQPTNETMGLKAAHSAENTTTEDPTPETPETVNVYWENYDGTVLFELEKVEVGHVPPADEYAALSGNEEPTEPADGETTYEFEGWEKTVEPDGDVIYTAQYEPDTPKTPTDPTKPDPKTPEDPTDPVIPVTPTTPATTPSQPTNTTPTPAPYTPNTAQTSEAGASLQQTGDNALTTGGLVAGAIALIALGGLSIAKRRNTED